MRKFIRKKQISYENTIKTDLKYNWKKNNLLRYF